MRVTSLFAPVFILALVAAGPRAAHAASAPATAAKATVSATAANAARGRVLAQTCAFCHGLKDYTIPYPTRHVPLIGGQHAAYVVSALKEYAENHRDFPTMRAQAASLTPAQIRDIAAYISNVGGPAPASNANQKAPAFAASCAACHGARGVSTNPNYPSLAGQYEDYLLLALKEYKSGKRKNPIMNGMAASLTLAQMKQLAHYFGTQRPALKLLPLAGPH